MHPILERFQEAQTRSSKGLNCIGAVFYLVDLDSVERFRKPGVIERYDPRIRRVPRFEDADIVGYGPIGALACRFQKGYVFHLMVIHPHDRTKIIEREERDQKMKISYIAPYLDWLQLSFQYDPVFFAVER